MSADETREPATAEQMKRGRTERETCDLNGWDVGTRLVGDEGYGPTVIRLTYFTEDGALLAVTESRNGEPVSDREHFWTLQRREWSVVTPPGQTPSDGET